MCIRDRFNSVRSGLMQVWRMNADGSEQTRVTWEEGSNCWFPQDVYKRQA